MGPFVHFLFTLFVVLGAAGALGIEVTLPVYILAVFGGLFPDFDHEKWEFILAMILAFASFFVFGVDKTGDVVAGIVLGAAAILLLVFLRGRHYSPPEYKKFPRREFRKEWWPKVRTVYGIGFIMAFALAAFLLSESMEIAFLAFLAYGSHAFLDHVTYGTDFGIKYLVAHSDF